MKRHSCLLALVLLWSSVGVIAADTHIPRDFGESVIEARASGDQDLYRAALLQFAATNEILSRSEHSETPAFSEAFLKDAMSAYIKLSNLEAGLGRIRESERYMQQAQELCKSVQCSCSRPRLQEYVVKIDAIDSERGRQW